MIRVTITHHTNFLTRPCSCTRERVYLVVCKWRKDSIPNSFLINRIFNPLLFVNRVGNGFSHEFQIEYFWLNNTYIYICCHCKFNNLYFLIISCYFDFLIYYQFIIVINKLMVFLIFFVIKEERNWYHFLLFIILILIIQCIEGKKIFLSIYRCCEITNNAIVLT